jgi:hypothetical protein
MGMRPRVTGRWFPTFGDKLMVRWSHATASMVIITHGHVAAQLCSYISVGSRIDRLPLYG